ncbi:apolipoprotein N-acyltransferase [Motilibacter deserti]|uniref:Apolipoprotein N-acyltransferase n=1 Tax=Motilibacter deserti TaxID=2714956 RepID=A0ABX0GUV1_9ACTN|nr:apolipoprotein N-acyltransferase [Motilibacter deserti]NHC14335.1 apolipoprotein N-acyltransferase [Motilibacter deserti]
MAPAERSRRVALRAVAAAGSGALLLLAFAPYSVWPAAPAGVALLSLATRGVHARRGAALGLLAGVTFMVPLLEWSGVYVGPAPWLLLAASQAAFFAGLGSVLALLGRLSPALWAFGTGAAWVLQEALRGRLPYGGFPWGRLGLATGDAAYTHLARLGGVPLVTFGYALAGGCLAAAVLGAARRRTAGATIALAAAAAVTLGPLAVPFAAPAARSAVVAVVQGDVPREGLDFNAQRQAVLRNHVARTHELANRVRAGEVPAPEIVLWPENSSDIDPFLDPSSYALIDDAVRDIGVPVLVGAVLRGPGEMSSNTGILWDPETGPGQSYVKRHPVPFAEYIPMRSIARTVSSAVDRVTRDFAAGDRVGVFDSPAAAPTLRLGDVICFEVGYDGLIRDTVDEGAQVLVVQTNNATFGRTPQTEQQLQMSRLRAQETGRWVLVAATSGVSAVVSPAGDVVQRTELFEPDVLVQRIALADQGQRTLASRLGLLPEAALALAAVALAAVPLAGTRRGRRLVEGVRRGGSPRRGSDAQPARRTDGEQQ